VLKLKKIKNKTTINKSDSKESKEKEKLLADMVQAEAQQDLSGNVINLQ